MLPGSESSAFDRLSTLLNSNSTSIDRVARVAWIVTRLAADVVVIESSFLTLVIAEAVFPVLPPLAKVGALATAGLAAVALTASTADALVQIADLQQTLSDAPRNLSEAEMDALSEQLDKFSDPFDALVEKLIDYLSALGVADGDAASYTNEVRKYNDARVARKRSVGAANKLKNGLAELDAAKELLKKGIEIVTKKRESEQRERKEALERVERSYPNGVDYPGPKPGPGAGPPNGNGGTAVA